MLEREGQLFVWRDRQEFSTTDDGVVPVFGSLLEYCPHCLKKVDADLFYYFVCTQCGFWMTEKHELIALQFMDPVSISITEYAILKKLSINDPKLELEELGTYLKQNFSNIYTLEPYRFEQLTADIFKQSGYHVRITKQSRDGGFDIALLEKSSGEQIIVECKRYAANRPVSVTTVRQIAGVQLTRDIKRAKIVTSSIFSKDARIEASHLNSNTAFELDLIDADDLLKELQVYNADLPSPSLTKLIM